MENVLAWINSLWGLGNLSFRDNPTVPGDGRLTLLGMGKAKESRDISGGGECRYVWKYALEMLVSPPQTAAFESFLAALGQGDFPYPKESFDREFKTSDVSAVKKTGGNTLCSLTFTQMYSI